MISIVTTVGTSLINNFISEKFRECKEQLRMHDNKKSRSKEWDSYLEEYKKYCIDKIKNEMRTNSNWVDISAEIKSITKIMEKYQGNEFIIQLISTDTVTSRFCSEVICDVLKLDKRKDITGVAFDSQKDVIGGLQIWNAKDFQEDGLKILIDHLESCVIPCINGEIPFTVYNITGGYKALIPYITIMAQINNTPIFYLFEDTDDLIEIPQMPININYSMFAKHKNVFEDLKNEIKDWKSYVRQKNLRVDDFQACIIEDMGSALLSPIGEMFWNRFNNYYYVLVPYRYSDEDGSNKQYINSTIKEIYKKINSYKSYNEFINNEYNNDIVHKKIGSNIAVGKFKKESQPLRIAYEMIDDVLYICAYTFNHDEYKNNYLDKQCDINIKDKFNFVEIVIRK
mgnify:CR=1 FL=1